MLHFRGFIRKFEGYWADKVVKLDAELKGSMKGYGYVKSRKIRWKGEGVFRMHNPQVLAVFCGFFGLHFMSAAMLLLECAREVAE